MKIRKSDIEIAKLTTKHLLLGMFDLVAPAYLGTRAFRRPIKKYLERRVIDYTTFLEKVKYLKRKGYIETFIEGKEKYIELTTKGKNHIKELWIKDIKIKSPKKWDGKWRVVIFDVPEEKKHERDILRERLQNLNFFQIQKSVYVYPFDCAQEIGFLSKSLFIKKSVIVMISEIIQGEDKIIADFLEKEILRNSDIK